METLDRLTWSALLFVLVLIGCNGTEPTHEEWKSVHQVAAESCDSLCAWQDRCAGTVTAECPTSCLTRICGAHDCAATPAGDDAAIDSCMDTLAVNATDGACGTAIGIPQTCQDLFVPPND